MQMDFMEHTCCQTKLNQNWMGEMALSTSIWKVLLGLLLPFVAIPLISFDSGEEDSSNQMSPDEKNADMAADGQSTNCCDIKKWPKSILAYHTAPFVKFCYHTISYIIFLGLFSFFMLTNLNPYHPGSVECIVWVWVFTMCIDEIRQIISTEPKTLCGKLSEHFSSSWNRFDIVVDLLFILSIILRLSLPPDTFIWARMFYAVTLTLYFIRFLQSFYVEKNIGPKVVMIWQMVIDLLFFLLILAVFLLAYGIAQQALRYPNAPYSWNILRDVVYQAYFSIYGLINVEEVGGDISPCTNNATVYETDPEMPRCPEQSWLVMVLFSIYLLLTNILLINLLIAMFSYTFNRVQENSEKYWRFYRYGLIKEYFIKPTLAPPLIIFGSLWVIGKYVFGQRKQEKSNNSFRRDFGEDQNRQFTQFERACMNDYYRQINVKRKEKEENERN